MTRLGPGLENQVVQCSKVIVELRVAMFLAASYSYVEPWAPDSVDLGE